MCWKLRKPSDTKLKLIENNLQMKLEILQMKNNLNLQGR